MLEARRTDFRSDTVTKPTQQMRKAMSKAEVGDDVYREDPTVDQLEREVAQLMGHESALFVPSRTMGNLISLMIWCSSRGSSFICGEKSHIFLCEEGGAAQFGGISPYPVPNEINGSMTLDNIQKAIISDSDVNVAELITLENPADRSGGVVLPMEYIQAVAQLARENNLKLHIDGSRIWNAATALGVQVKDIAQYADSLTVCISKGLGAPCGSLLVGSRSFTERARKVRKALGGAMRQVGILAAAGLVSIRSVYPRLIEDHKNVQRLATAAAAIPGIRVDMPLVQTNIVIMDLDERLNLTAPALVEELERRGILALSIGPRRIRFVTHYDVNEAHVRKAAQALEKILQPYRDICIPNSSTPSPPSTHATVNTQATDSTYPNSDPPSIPSPTHVQSEAAASAGVPLVDTTAANILVNLTTSAAEATPGSSPAVAAAAVANVVLDQTSDLVVQGVSTSEAGFTLVLAEAEEDKSERRALKVAITPSDPMSAGLDVYTAETPEAVTMLQLLQNIDVGSHLKHDALASLVGLGAGTSVHLRRAIIQQLSADDKKAFKARLEVEVGEGAGSSNKAEGGTQAPHTKVVFTDVKSPFLAMALAFRYDARIACHRQLLYDAAVSLDLSSVRASFPGLLEIRPGESGPPTPVALDLETEYEIGRLEKQLTQAIQDGKEEGAQKIRRRLALYRGHNLREEVLPLLEQAASVSHAVAGKAKNTPAPASTGPRPAERAPERASRPQIIKPPPEFVDR